MQCILNRKDVWNGIQMLSELVSDKDETRAIFTEIALGFVSMLQNALPDRRKSMSFLKQGNKC